MNLLGRTINGTRTRFERFNIVIAILLAGWVPSILMLWVAYTILTRTLETKILRDRQTLVQLIAHLVGDDLTGKTTIIDSISYMIDDPFLDSISNASIKNSFIKPGKTPFSKQVVASELDRLVSLYKQQGFFMLSRTVIAALTAN